MNRNRSQLLHALPASRASEGFDILHRMLSERGTRVLPTATAPLAKSGILPVWEARQKIARSQGNHFPGLANLLHDLREMPGDPTFEVIALVGTTYTATLFFTLEREELAGYVLAEISDHTRAYFEVTHAAKPATARAARPAARLLETA